MSKNYGNDSQIAEIVKYISDTMKLPLIGAGGGFAPLGFYGFSCDYVLTPPQGWLFADGSIYNIADYPEYAALLASQHGRANIYGGDGVTTFATKDLRGEFLRGWGQNSHENQGSGANVGVHQDGTIHASVGGWGGGAAISQLDITLTNKDKAISDGTYDRFNSVSQSSGSGWETYTSRPTNTSVAFFVKATLSDAEINAFHVYTPREHQVGWWEEEIDGVWKRKPVYEKTVKDAVTLPSVNNTAVYELGSGYIIRDYDGYAKDSNGNPTYLLKYSGNNAPLNIYLNTPNTGDIHFTIGTGNADWVGRKVDITLQYTKTTDQWQTS